MMHAPPPGEWHPAYAGYPWLWDWLHGRGRFADRNDVALPVMRRRRTLALDDDPVDPDIRTRHLTRHKAVGPAPWVGRPYCYAWPVGVDELGRAIAGEAHLVYLDQERAPWMT